MLVEAEIWTVARTDKGNAVLIRPLESDHAVPIFIGQLEAQSILIGMGNVPMPRPLTHDLFLSFLEKFHYSIERIEINDLKEGTFYARLVIKQGMKRYVFDCRPSDALGMATRVQCPVYIAEFIVDEAGIPVQVVNESSDLKVSEEIKDLQKEELDRQLKQAVDSENYEEAARIRDLMKDIEDTNESTENDNPDSDNLDSDNLP